MEKMKEVLLVAGVVLLVMFPYIWKGQGVQLNVWDNLDSNVVWYKMLKDQDKIFAGPEVLVEGFVTETPRFSYPSGWNVELIFVYFFDIFTAYWLNKLLIVVIAFASMYTFLKKEINKEHGLILGLSLVWATLAFYPHRGISIAALPLIFIVFQQLREGQNVKWGLFIIILYSFYSMFVLAGFYIWSIFFMISIFWMIKDKRYYGNLFLGLMIWMITYMFLDYQLFYFLFFQDGFLSHRQEITYMESIWSGLYPWDFLIRGDHAGVLYWPGYLLLAIIFVVFILLKRKAYPYISFFGSILVIIAVICSMISLLAWLDTVGEWIPSLHSLNLSRFSFMLPFPLFALVALGFLHLDFMGKKWIIMAFLGVNIFIYQYEWRNLMNEKINILPYKVPSYREYYAIDLYDEIKQYLGNEIYQITFGHVNLPPAVSAYNGLTAVDGYLQNYSLEYKHKIREVIRGELAKDRSLSSHFDDWGNKCYLQNATYPDVFDAYKWKRLEPIEHLDFDYHFLSQNLKVKYLLSAVEIKNEKLKLMKIFSHTHSAWVIYLYRIS